MFSVENLSIEKKSIKKSDVLDKYVKLMKDQEVHQNGYTLLPKNEWYEVSFELHNSNAGFANGIRRVLVGELEVQSMVVEEKDILTDDEFIAGMNDVLVKNIGLIPIYQDHGLSVNEYDIYLYAYNNTNDIIDIKVKDISVVAKTRSKHHSKVKGGLVAGKDDDTTDLAVVEDISDTESTTDTKLEKKTVLDGKLEDSTALESDTKLNSKLFPEGNITFVRLRPGKYIKMRNISFVSGKATDDAGRFTLLNNIRYKPLDIEPYDQFTGKGTRSIEHNCKKFALSFTTCGNITPKQVMNKVQDSINTLLNDIKSKVAIFDKAPTSTYYNGEGCEVTITDNMYNYKFPGHYFTPMNMISMQCYELDNNILHCSSAVERYDTLVGILRLKHPNPNELIGKAIDVILANLDKLVGKF
jgi:hypothetical protein